MLKDMKTEDLVKEIQARYKAESITTPGKVVELFSAADKGRKKEYCWVVLLDGQNKPIKKVLVSIGIVNKSLVHPREVFYPAIKNLAAGLIFVHNHPSGNLTASSEDANVFDRLKKAGEILGIPVLDSIIITKVGFISLVEEGV